MIEAGFPFPSNWVSSGGGQQGVSDVPANTLIMDLITIKSWTASISHV